MKQFIDTNFWKKNWDDKEYFLFIPLDIIEVDVTESCIKTETSNDDDIN